MSDKEKIIRILCDALDGCPLLYPCDKLFSPDGWCREHCKPGQDAPDAECWLKYAEVMTSEALRTKDVPDTNIGDLISRQGAIDALDHCELTPDGGIDANDAREILEQLPSVQPERKWTPCSNPPKHHKDVIVRGIEAIGNVTVHKVMQWDVDTWRPTDYAPSIMWKEWSEI